MYSSGVIARDQAIIAEGDEREWRGDHHFFEGLEKSSNGRYQSFWGS